jgi:hypothetical protein
MGEPGGISVASVMVAFELVLNASIMIVARAVDAVTASSAARAAAGIRKVNCLRRKMIILFL